MILPDTSAIVVTMDTPSNWEHKKFVRPQPPPATASQLSPNMAPPPMLSPGSNYQQPSPGGGYQQPSPGGGYQQPSVGAASFQQASPGGFQRNGASGASTSQIQWSSSGEYQQQTGTRVPLTASSRDRSRSPDNRMMYVSSSQTSPQFTPQVNGAAGTAAAGDWSHKDGMSGEESNSSSIPTSPLTPQTSLTKSPGAKDQAGRGTGVAGKSIEEELCLICGDRASGYHYNALSCEGCKGFFRRSITRGASYNCKYGGHCEMDMWMRRRCQACRLRRCREVGMKEECLLSDEQCKARDARRKARQRILKIQQGIDPDAPEPKVVYEEPATTKMQSKPTSPDSGTDVKKESVGEAFGPVPNPLDYLTSSERDLIESIVIYQDKYELPTESDIKKLETVQISDIGRPKEVAEHIYKHMAEMTILVTQLVVEFAKNLPGFMELDKEDQIILLKGSASEVMVLRTARRYDLETDSVVFANGTPFTQDSMRFAGLQTYVESMFNFCRQMGNLAVDNAEYALLTAICIFSDRPGLQNHSKVEEVQELYVNALMSYHRWRRPKKAHYLAKLLLKLVELRSLSAEHSDVLFALKVEKGSLPPLISEYFDLVD